MESVEPARLADWQPEMRGGKRHRVEADGRQPRRQLRMDTGMDWGCYCFAVVVAVVVVVAAVTRLAKT